jgi:hypothetical protein
LSAALLLRKFESVIVLKPVLERLIAPPAAPAEGAVLPVKETFDRAMVPEPLIAPPQHAPVVLLLKVEPLAVSVAEPSPSSGSRCCRRP